MRSIRLFLGQKKKKNAFSRKKRPVHYGSIPVSVFGIDRKTIVVFMFQPCGCNGSPVRPGYNGRGATAVFFAGTRLSEEFLIGRRAPRPYINNGAYAVRATVPDFVRTVSVVALSTCLRTFVTGNYHPRDTNDRFTCVFCRKK